VIQTIVPKLLTERERGKQKG